MEVFDVELAHVMTHIGASRPLRFPLFSYSLDYDRRMTYVIFKGSKTRTETGTRFTTKTHRRSGFLKWTPENKSWDHWSKICPLSSRNRVPDSRPEFFQKKKISA